MERTLVASDTRFRGFMPDPARLTIHLKVSIGFTAARWQKLCKAVVIQRLASLGSAGLNRKGRNNGRIGNPLENDELEFAAKLGLHATAGDS
jgi:hypothetical protein